MTIEELVAAVVAEAEKIEAGHGELPSVVCGKTEDGTECHAFIRVKGGTEDIPASDSWEGALGNLLAVLKGDTEAVDTAIERRRLQRIKARAEKDASDAQADLDALPVREVVVER